MGIGIGIGVVIGVAVTFSLVAFAGMSQDSPILLYNEPKLAYITANYFDDTDRLSVALVLTDKNADYTTADGVLTLQVFKGRNELYSQEYEFKKDDFYAWKNLAGDKVTGYRIQVDKYFSSGSHDVYLSFVTSDGARWENLHDSFYSLN